MRQENIVDNQAKTFYLERLNTQCLTKLDVLFAPTKKHTFKTNWYYRL
ncbi:hypothetical protein N476_21195 [Pseudoalteromonas luteoviolacea H33]|uniref:Uncharacterized protein n=1 Tax=Pseudoalteromonas luteoviolacea H33 TaxID=1365251 RepID=A0A162AF79_9GAMM|nr:hypothetical protein N476_21195 [Pseudoalteromonas luteoviolacea H33]KZN75432.1 hypothetical protein N477_01590 [Pseudoalteromonas luteoviolacea H33-S]